MLVSLIAFLLCLFRKIMTKTFLVKTKEEFGNAGDYISKDSLRGDCREGYNEDIVEKETGCNGNGCRYFLTDTV